MAPGEFFQTSETVTKAAVSVCFECAEDGSPPVLAETRAFQDTIYRAFGPALTGPYSRRFVFKLLSPSLNSCA